MLSISFKTVLAFLTNLTVWSLIICICYLTSTAQTSVPRLQDEYNLRNWKGEDGLPQHTVTSIVQTADGYIWLGTNGGLVRFDGIRFQVFGGTEGLSSNRVARLFESRDGTLWIVSDGGLVTQYKQGKFKKVDGSDGLPAEGVRNVYEDRAGNLWFSTTNGVVKWNQGNSIRYEKAEWGEIGVVNSLLESHNGEMWLATGTGLVKFDGQYFTRFHNSFPGISNLVKTLLETKDGTLWVGTEVGVFRFKDGTFTFYKLIKESKFKTEPESYSVTSFLQDHNGILWVGSSHGISRLIDNKLFTDKINNESPTNNSYIIFEGKEKNLWIGAATSGLYRLSKGIIKSYNQDNGFPGKSVVPILEDKSHNLWIGGTCGGLFRFRDKEFTIYGKKDGFQDNSCVWAFHQDRTDGLWIGTYTGGLWRLHNEKFTEYRFEDGQRIGGINSIYEDHLGTIWIGGAGGLHQFKDGIFTNYSQKDGLIHNKINFIGEDQDQNLLIGTSGGISRFKDGKFINYSPVDGLPNSTIRDIKVDSDGTLWIGTYGGGLSRFKDGKFFNFTTKSGLFENIVSRILEDDEGRFWTSGNRGIAMVSRKDLNDFADGKISKITSISYGIADGMHIVEANGGGQPAGYKTSDGLLWFPTIDGLVSIDPKLTNKVLPPVFIEEMTVDDNQIDLSSEIKLAADSSNLEIKYTALSYTAPEKIKFKYKLERYDKEWIAADGRRAAYYSNLPPGNYRFHVIACNNDGVWNETGVVFEFQLEPYFYQTYYFYGLCTIGAGILVVGLHRIRVRQLEKQQRVLEVRQKVLTQLVDERTEAMEKLSTAQKFMIEQERLRALGQMASGVAHDFNNALSPILGYAELLLRFPKNLENKEKVVQNLNIIVTAAKDAAKIVSRLRAFYRLTTQDEKFLRVNISQLTAQALTLTKPKWKDQTLQRGITIQTKTELQEELFIACDESEIREVLINLIFNAVDAMPQGGTLCLRTFARDEQVCLEIRDTGTGMSEEVRQRCLEPFFSTKGEHGTGLGLSMVYGIIQRHHGTVEIDTELGKGTTFRLILPKWTEQKTEETEMEEIQATSALNILIVEDEEPIRELVAQMMIMEGHQVETAANGVEGLEKFREGKFELVLTDSAMPQMSGEQMVREIKKIDPQMKIILMTGFGEILNDAKEKPAGINMILTKPVPMDELKAAIAELFES